MGNFSLPGLIGLLIVVGLIGLLIYRAVKKK